MSDLPNKTIIQQKSFAQVEIEMHERLVSNEGKENSKRGAQGQMGGNGVVWLWGGGGVLSIYQAKII